MSKDLELFDYINKVIYSCMLFSRGINKGIHTLPGSCHIIIDCPTFYHTNFPYVLASQTILKRPTISDLQSYLYATKKATLNSF